MSQNHVGLWSVVITEGEAYGLAQEQSCHIFKSEESAYRWALSLLMNTSDAVTFYRGRYWLDGDGYVNAKELVEAYQWSLAGLDWFHVFPAFHGE